MTGYNQQATQLYTVTIKVSSFKTSTSKQVVVRAASREDATIKAGYSVLDLAKHFIGDTSGIQLETISVVERHIL